MPNKGQHIATRKAIINKAGGARVARVWLCRPCRAGGLRLVENPIETDMKPIWGLPEASCPISWVLEVASDASGVAVVAPGSP